MTEAIPTVRAYRPVLNLNENVRRGLLRLAYEEGLESKDMHIHGHAEKRVDYLRPGAVPLLCVEAGISLTPKLNRELCTYINTHRPRSTYRDLSVPALPSGRHYLSAAKELFTLGADNATGYEELAQIRSMVEEFLGLDEEDTSELWYLPDYMAEVEIAHIRRPAAESFQRVLGRRPGCVPQAIELGEMVLRTSTINYIHKG